MHPVILGNDFSPEKPIYDFKSFVFTERFQDHGDFQLISTDDGIIQGDPLLRPGKMIVASNSATPMITTSIDVRIDDNGSVETTYKGKTLDYLFTHRPCVKEIRDKTYMDAEYKNGWEFGDKDGDERLNWMTVWKELFTVASSNYGHKELDFLKLPFEPIIYGDQIGFIWHYQVYATFDGGTSMWEAFKRIMENNNSTIRFQAPPFAVNEWWQFYPWPSDHFKCFHYRGQDRSDFIIFDTFDDSLLKGQLSVNIENVKNAVIFSNEDHTWVAKSFNAWGQYAHVSYATENMAKQSDYDWEKTVETRIYQEPYKTLSSGFNLSVEVAPTSGSMKRYGTPSDENTFDTKKRDEYWLGDLVGVQVPYFTSILGVDRILARVTEFTRIEDETGYREYPSLAYCDYKFRTDLQSPWAIKKDTKYDWN